MEVKHSPTPSARRSVTALAGAAVLAGLAWGSSTAALAGDVTWSIGVSSPGVQLGVFGPQAVYAQPQPDYVQPPVYVQPQPYYVPTPVYVQPQVIYTQPRTVYLQPQPVYVQPRPVYVQPQPVYVQPQPVVVYNGWHHPRHGWQHGPRPYPQHYPQQFSQPRPVPYHTLETAYGHGDRQR